MSKHSRPYPAGTATRQAIGELGMALRQGNTSKEPELRRNLYAAQLEDHVQHVISQFPPLTPEQRERLAVLLRDGGA